MRYKELIREFKLRPHPEGGFYRETYRAAGIIPQTALPPAFHGNRSFSTAIYFLLPTGARSRLHRIASDEIWHFYLGAPLRLVEVDHAGSRQHRLGPDFAAGQTLQHVVPAGCWFGALSTGEFSLVGCTVAPGFDFAEFELADRAELLQCYPESSEIILELT